MKRLCALVVLMVASSSADAGTISFSVGGHRIRIETPRGCSSSSCASISIPGVYESRRKRDDDPGNTVTSPPPPSAPAQVAPPPAPAPVQQTAPPAPRPVVAATPAPAPLAVYKPAAVTTQEVAPPPLPPVPPPVQPAASVTQPCTTPPASKPDESARPATAVLKVLHEEDATDSPLGDWQTEGKGMVRIAECGRSLCGHAIKEGESEKGEAVLINMKPKSDTQWSGRVYSKDSGDTYYGTMRLRGPNTMRVEACAFSRFYCNGNNWIRITAKPIMTSRQVTDRPRS
ncbi:MAG TPA: DUF2147 domain-containing protein [Bradyrhizobium sp.]|nr:DUF2147 domain-containing protein [Bradyrhizobium sp.]